MKILIPMAGEGSRFVKEGYTFPKPLIDVKGKPMIQKVVENLDFDCEYIFLVRKKHIEDYEGILGTLSQVTNNNFKYVVVDGLTEGAACTALLAKEYIDNDEEVKFTTPRNRFYEQNHYSMVKTLFNKDQGSVKRFKTLNYEGSQAQLVPKGSNTLPGNFYEIEGVNVGQIYYDNYAKDGWYVHHLETDLQEGTIKEFIDKENKWFDYIRGKEGDLTGDELDTGDFSLQGIGIYT